MDGWLFAVTALVAILGFELLVFRYFADDGPVGDTTIGTNDATAAGTGQRRPPGGTATGAAADESTRQCHNCGAANADVSTFHYCQRCLTRIH